MSSNTHENVLSLDLQPESITSRTVAETAGISVSAAIASISCALTSGPLAPILAPICGVMGGIIGALIASIVKGEFSHEPGPISQADYMSTVTIANHPDGIIFSEKIPFSFNDVFIFYITGENVRTKPVFAFRAKDSLSLPELILSTGKKDVGLSRLQVFFNNEAIDKDKKLFQKKNVSISGSGNVGFAPAYDVHWMVLKQDQYAEAIKKITGQDLISNDGGYPAQVTEIKRRPKNDSVNLDIDLSYHDSRMVITNLTMNSVLSKEING